MPLQSLKEFEILFAGGSQGGASRSEATSPTRSGTRQTQDRSATKASSPVRRVRSLSPLKDGSTGATRDGSQRTKGNAGTSSTVPKATPVSSDASANNAGATQKERKVSKSTDSPKVDRDTSNQEVPEPQSAGVTRPKRTRKPKEELSSDIATEDSEKAESSTETPSTPPAKAQSKTEQRPNKPSTATKTPSLKLTHSSGVRESQTGRKKRTSALGESENETEFEKPNRGS